VACLHSEGNLEVVYPPPLTYLNLMLDNRKHVYHLIISFVGILLLISSIDPSSVISGVTNYFLNFNFYLIHYSIGYYNSKTIVYRLTHYYIV